MKSAFAFGLIGLGLVLLVLSGIWTSLFSGASGWTPEKAARSSEIKNRLHSLSFVVNSPKTSVHRGQDRGALQAEYEQLLKENDQYNADFTSATEGPKTISKIFKWSGISMVLLGIIGWYAVSDMNP